MGVIRVKENKIIFSRRDETAVIEPFGADCLRFRSTRNSKIQDENWTLITPPQASCEINNHGNWAEIINGKISAKIYDNGKVTYYKDGKEILAERSEYAFLSRFRDYKHKYGDLYKITICFEPKEDEHFYGLGQEQNDCFDLKGATSTLIHYNTKSSIPFVYSSLGYGFLWNSPSIGRCELTTNHTLWESECAKQADYIIIAGDTPKEVLYKYSSITGFAPKFPKWASGFWQSRLRYESQEDLLEIAREYKKRGVPLSAIIIDYFHWTQQGEWKFDPKYWPNPKEMVDELKQMGVETIVSVWPTINPQSENYHYMNERNMLIRTTKGQYGLFDFYGLQSYIDPTNPETRKYVWEKIKQNYYSHGIKTFWLDEAEPEILPRDFDNLILHKGYGEEVGLLYPYYYAKLFYEGLKECGEEEIISLVRAAWIGSQRYGTLVWSGDIPSTFEALRKSIKTALSMSMCGIVWWNSDIGGFWGGDIESDYFKELIVRWFQFGVFCPVMRLHGSRNRPKNHVHRHPEVLEKSGGDNEIWSFGEEVYETLKDLIFLRERLRPYIEKYMDEASESGVSILRPMFLEYPDDETCYTLSDQYMFGEDILFAPIVNRGQTERKVYLPKGRWVSVIDKKVYEGGTFITQKAEINQFIAFVKEGKDIINVF